MNKVPKYICFILRVLFTLAQKSCTHSVQISVWWHLSPQHYRNGLHFHVPLVLVSATVAHDDHWASTFYLRRSILTVVFSSQTQTWSGLKHPRTETICQQKKFWNLREINPFTFKVFFSVVRKRSTSVLKIILLGTLEAFPIERGFFAEKGPGRQLLFRGQV